MKTTEYVLVTDRFWDSLQISLEAEIVQEILRYDPCNAYNFDEFYLF